MRTELRKKAIDLRTEQHASYSEIKRRLGVSKSTLSYWLRDYPLSSRRIYELRLKGWKKGEASRELFRSTMRAKKELAESAVYRREYKKLKNLSGKSLFVAGLMLYLAEGAKHKEASIVLANTDYRVIGFFVKWLEVYLQIPKGKLRIQLHLYENMDVSKELLFWRRNLGLKQTQLYKPSIRPLKKGSFTYKESFRHGTCSLYAFGVENRTRLMMAIKALMRVGEEWTMRV